MRRVIVSALVSVGCFALGTPQALAFETGATASPAAYVKRNLTLRAGQLRLDGAPPDHGLLNSGFRNTGRGFRIRHFSAGAFDETFVSLGLGAGYGITDEFEVGVFLLPLMLTPDFDFGNMEFYGRYTFLSEGAVSVAAQAGIGLPTGDRNFGGLGVLFPTPDNFTLTLGVPVVLRLSETLRIDTGGEIELILGDNTDVHFDFPASFLFQITDVVYLGPTTAFLIVDGDELAIEAGFALGFTILQNNAPLVDLVAELEFPFFLWTGPGDTVNFDLFTITLGARMYFTVM